MLTIFWAYMDCLEKLRLLAYMCPAFGTHALGNQLGCQDSGEPQMTLRMSNGSVTGLLSPYGHWAGVHKA